MIATSITQTIPYTPAWLCGPDKVTPLPGSPVFHLRAAGVMERSAFEAEIAAPPHSAGRVTAWDLRRSLREGVEALFSDDPEVDRILEAVAAEEDAIQAALDTGADAIEPLPADVATILAETRKIMLSVPGEFADLNARVARRNLILPVLALHRFCVSWEGYEQPLKRDIRGLIRDDVLRQVAEFEMMAAGLRAYELQWVGDQAGNSSRPSTSGDGQTTSNSDVKPSAAGRSARKNGRKTPGSRSPRGSGR